MTTKKAKRGARSARGATAARPAAGKAKAGTAKAGKAKAGKANAGTAKAGKAKAGAAKAKAGKAGTTKAKAGKAKAAKAKPARPRKARSKARATPTSKPRRTPDRSAAREEKWPKFVEQHGVVLASARGPVPSVAEAIAGEPIVGSWWSHPKAPAIFDALSVIDDSDDIRCFKLVDHKITFVHRRLWPALACLALAGVLDADRVASIQQQHMPTGEHRNFTTPFPDWVPDDAGAAAATMSVDEARAQLGSWL